jgi:hypothetical protein
MNATALAFDDVFASAGFFGVEIASDVAALAGERVTLRGYVYGPLASDAKDYAFARGSLRYCPCCSGEPSFGDDLVLVRLRQVPAEPPDGDREVEITGMLETGHAESGHPRLATSVRLLDAVLEPELAESP